MTRFSTRRGRPPLHSSLSSASPTPELLRKKHETFGLLKGNSALTYFFKMGHLTEEEYLTGEAFGRFLERYRRTHGLLLRASSSSLEVQKGIGNPVDEKALLGLKRRLLEAIALLKDIHPGAPHVVQSWVCFEGDIFESKPTLTPFQSILLKRGFQALAPLFSS